MESTGEEHTPDEITQKIKYLGNTGQKGAILGALTLYLDFINMFLIMLRVLNDRR